MNTPEYLEIFANEGDYLLKVRFKDKTKSIIQKHIQANEIAKLISPETNQFYTKMYFDQYLLSIEKIEINLIKKEIVIKTS